jgi:hypothetical protein
MENPISEMDGQALALDWRFISEATFAPAASLQHAGESRRSSLSGSDAASRDPAMARNDHWDGWIIVNH